MIVTSLYTQIQVMYKNISQHGIYDTKFSTQQFRNCNILFDILEALIQCCAIINQQP